MVSTPSRPGAGLIIASLSSEHPSIKVIATLAAVAITSSDADLIEASISELHQQSPEAKLSQDPVGQSDLVLFLHSLAQSPDAPEDALDILESAVQLRPSDPIARNRLAKAFIASGRYEEANDVLDGVMSRDGDVLSEAYRLKGIARVAAGEEGAGEIVQKAVLIRPWEEKSWEALTWSRQVEAEV